MSVEDDIEARSRAAARAILQLADAGRLEDLILAGDEFLTRFGEEAAIGVRRRVARIMFERAFALGSLDRREQETAGYLALVDRFGAEQDLRIRRRVVWAHVNLGIELAAQSREQPAIDHLCAAAKLAAAQSGDDFDEPRVRALLHLGHAYFRDRRFRQALAAYRELLDHYGDSQDADVVADVAEARTWVGHAVAGRADMLAESGHALEAAVVLETAREHEIVGTDALGDLVDTFIRVSNALCEAGEHAAADRLPVLLAELLDSDPEPDPEPAPAGAADDEAIAALLADAFEPGMWRLLGDVGEDRDVELHAARALGLYRATAPAAASLGREGDVRAPRTAAVMLLRGIGDMHAILSAPGRVDPQEASAIADRGRVELGVRTLGLDDWAESLGYPLPLFASIESSGELPDSIDTGAEAALVASLRLYELLRVVRGSHAAAAVFRRPAMGSYAVSLLRFTQGWVARAELAGADFVPVGLACLVFAQALFVAVHGSVEDDWFPDRELFRAFAEEDRSALELLDGVPGWVLEP